MPRVQAYGERRIGSRASAGVKRTAVPSPQSFGAGLGEQAAQLGIQMFAESQRRVAQIELRDADEALAAFEFERRTNTQDGWETQRGIKAAGLPDKVGEDFDKAIENVRPMVNHPRARQAFDELAADRKLQAKNWAAGFAGQQIRQHDTERHNAYLENAVNNGIANFGNLERVGVERQRIIAETKDWGARYGQSQEEIDREISKGLTALHVGVINRYLAVEQDKAAAAYYGEVKDQIAGEARAQVEKVLEEGTLRGEAQRTADGIILAGGTLTSQREKVRAIDDPKLRDEVQQRVEHEWTVNDRIEREQDEARLLNAYNLVEKGGLRAIPPAVWSSLQGSQRSALKSYAEAKASGTAIKTDMNTLYTLLTLSSTNPDAFLKTNLMQYRNALSNGDLEQMMRKQAEMRGGKSGDTIFASEGMQNEVIDAGLGALGLDVTPSQLREDKPLRDRVTAFRRAVREAVDRQVATTGKKATRDEIQVIVDALTAPTGKKMVKDGWFWDTYAPAYAFETAQAQVQSVKDVPPAERQKIVNALRARGIEPRDEIILQLFNERLSQIRGDR